MNGHELKSTESEKDIEVFIHKSLTPSLQVAEAAKKANQVLGQLLRTVTYRDKVHFLKLYKQRVRYATLSSQSRPGIHGYNKL